jgi:hypothetical protein
VASEIRLEFESQQKAATTPDFHFNGFRSVRLEHIESFLNNPPTQSLVDATLSLFAEFVTNDLKCLAVAVHAESLHRTLPSISHHAYALILSCEDAILYADVNA